MEVRNNSCIIDYEILDAILCEALNEPEIRCPCTDQTPALSALDVAKIFTPMSGVLKLMTYIKDVGIYRAPLPFK